MAVREALGRLGPRAARRRQVHILHIGKTAGTQLIRLLGQVNSQAGRAVFLAHPHAVRLVDITPRADYLFGLRDPVTRFRSAFYSRRRCGRPAYDVPWRPDEALAFAAFPHANDLAEALFDDGPTGEAARAAIQSIQHAADHQIDWFAPQGFFLQRRPPVAIFRQEVFERDWTRFAASLGLGSAPSVSHDPRRAHANDYTDAPVLSDKAVAALRQWYARDVAFCATCSAWAEDPPPPPDWLIAAVAG